MNRFSPLSLSTVYASKIINAPTSIFFFTQTNGSLQRVTQSSLLYLLDQLIECRSCSPAVFSIPDFRISSLGMSVLVHCNPDHCIPSRLCAHQWMMPHVRRRDSVSSPTSISQPNLTRLIQVVVDLEHGTVQLARW